MQAQDHAHCPPTRAAEAAPHAREARQAVGEVIPSERLLLGQACVTIDHDGTHYVLRATRAGKLILTK
ncbi:hemin uptake protein HemP [Aromatoleum evansii]|uniref:Hemin uptake protein HemP n=1 Tax=Aromatoleum evansii TaxID=59406 RepID=A0ABZ1ALK7_AROEV|nr:hemin uptake protein HemP [Aromatoleum evansii]NMG32006.1 hemin uptake protein HemP [Aromatoleum evansii]WRL45799.1 hemin uptake protein HemP [Aromatoleum evansii]